MQVKNTVPIRRYNLLVAESGDLRFTKTDSLCYDMLR